MIILTLNAGSSSIKYKLFDSALGQKALISGQVDAIAQAHGSIKQTIQGKTSKQNLVFADHAEALNYVGNEIQKCGHLVALVAHRVVHGGISFSEPTRLDTSSLDILEALVPLAPLHNPANITGIKVAMERFQSAQHVAIFDTAFHQTMPKKAFTYAIDQDLAKQHHIRKYGFHGTSHDYVSQKAADQLGKDRRDCQFISCHLGNGASICAIKNGQSIDTSMGMTPLAGLVMGTRSGDIDPGVLIYLQREAGLSANEVDTLLNKESGLQGLCGDSDMRTIESRIDQGDPTAKLALEIFVYRCQQVIGAYLTQLPNLDAILFTGGIGENAPVIRAAILEPMSHLGFGSAIQTLVIETDEEWQMAIAAQSAI